MAHVTLPEVQQWIEITKLDLTDDGLDVELEKTATEFVFSRLGEVYNTSTWVDETTTPNLVRKIISLLIAAWIYERAYSEDNYGQVSYAEELEKIANDLITGIAAGTVALTDVPGTPSTVNSPVFWPNDTTGSSAVYDGLGRLVGFEGSEDTKFRMGARF